MVAELRYSAAEATSDPADKPVIFIGQAKNLQRVAFSKMKAKLEPRVTEELWTSALDSLSPSPTDTVNLYLNSAVVCALPSKCSRHNAPSRAHAITKLVRACSSGQAENIVIVCDRPDVYASGCAVARAFPLYSRKTSGLLSNSTNNSGDASSPRKARPAAEVNVEFLAPSGEQVATQEELSALQDASFGIRLAARIVDAPCNEMHTDAFVQEVNEVGKALGIKPVVVRGEELRKRGFGGIYGVGKAAVHPPAMAVLSHEPEGATETVAWVGKGIVYDTGGLSIKGKTAMPGMKRDCGGAAGILGAFYAAVKQGFKQNLHAIFCLAENAVGDRATRPDDIHTLYSGRTVEINNTDAEGRLVLSDGVVYAHRDLGAGTIVDMATLTGAQGIACGRYHAAHLTNKEDWERFCLDAGRASADLSFPVVYCPELHFPEFSSAVADMKNSVADRSNAQPSCAGQFIHAHLGFDFPGNWLHVDMAAPAYVGERSTGYGIALLNTLFGAHSQNALLNEIAPFDSSSSNGAGEPMVVASKEGGGGDDATVASSGGSRSKKMRKK